MNIEFFLRVRSILPVVAWLPSYKSSNLKWDLLAGVTLAFFVIPESMAYASLAGLPPHTGIYCYLFAGLLYFLFGSSKQLAIGPTSALSIVIGGSIATLSGGDPAKVMFFASGTALIVSALFLLAWMIRLSALVNFISETILIGFKAGAALVIASTQLPKLFGIEATGHSFIARIGSMILHLNETNLTILIFGIIALTLLIAGHRLFPGKPISLLVVMGSIVFVWLSGNLVSGVSMIGKLPGGIPSVSVPLLSSQHVTDLLSLATACFILSYVESISAARSLAAKSGYEVNARQELLALGSANFAASLGSGFPVAGGLSQSSVNDKAGAKSPLSLVITSIVLGASLLFLTGLFRYLPEVILAVIVLDAIIGLINIKEIRHLFKVSRLEFWISMSTILAVLLFGVLNGVLTAVVLSLVFLLKQAATPHIAILGQIPGTSNYSDMQRHPDNLRIEGVLILRIEASILYFNINNIHDKIHQIIDGYPGELKLVVMDLSSANYVDVAGARFFLTLEDDLEKRGIGLQIVEALGQARDILRAEGMEKEIGHISRKVTIHDVVTSAGQPHDTALQR